jgi:hypothetical protein
MRHSGTSPGGRTGPPLAEARRRDEESSVAGHALPRLPPFVTPETKGARHAD